MESLKKCLERVKISIDSHIKDDIKERKKIRGISSYRKNRMRAAKVKAVPSNPRRLKMNGGIKSMLSGLKKQMPAAEMQGMISGSLKQEMPSAKVQGLTSDAGKKMPSAKVQGLTSDAGKEMPSARVDANCNIVFKENFKTLFIEREYFINQDVKRCMEELINVHKRLLVVFIDFNRELHKKCEELLRHEDTCDVRHAQKVEARNCAFQAIKMIHSAASEVCKGYKRIKVLILTVVNMYGQSTINDNKVGVDLLIESLPASLRDGNERFFIEKALDITNCMVNKLNRHFKPIYEQIQDLECLLKEYFDQTRVVLY